MRSRTRWTVLVSSLLLLVLSPGRARADECGALFLEVLTPCADAADLDLCYLNALLTFCNCEGLRCVD